MTNSIILELRLLNFSSKLKAQGSKLKAQSSKFKAQSSKFKAQSFSQFFRFKIIRILNIRSFCSVCIRLHKPKPRRM